MHNLKKALTISAFFFGCCLIPYSSQAASCPEPINPQAVTVASVYDGDTLLLDDGRKVRLIGINTPERGRNGKPDQPLARQATNRLTQLIKDRSPVQIQVGQQSHDRYNRLLAHLFLDDGSSAEAELLRQGLGFAISMAPNLALRDCLNQAERQARQQQLGVWSLPDYQPLPVNQLDTGSSGFGRYRGTITKAGSIKNGNYLELNEKVFVILRSQAQHWFQQVSSDDLVGRQLQVRGWLVHRKLTKPQIKRGFLPFLLNINHPDGLKLCHTDC